MVKQCANRIATLFLLHLSSVFVFNLAICLVKILKCGEFFNVSTALNKCFNCNEKICLGYF